MSAAKDWGHRNQRPTAVDELSSYGATEVSRFIDATRANELRMVVNDIYTDLVNAKESGNQAFLANEKFADHFTRWYGVNMEQLIEYLNVARPDLARSWGGLVDHVRDRTRTIFGANWRLVPARSWLRRHVGVTRKVPWHVDADAAAMGAFGREAFNVWLPLESVGHNSPSLDVIRGSHKTMRGQRRLVAPDIYRDDAFAATLGHASTPVLEPGDALAFDQYMLHRTQPVGSTNTTRTACEFRFVEPYPPLSLAGLTGVAKRFVRRIKEPV